MGEETKDLFGKPNRVYFISKDNVVQWPVVSDSITMEECDKSAIREKANFNPLSLSFDACIVDNSEIARLLRSVKLEKAKEMHDSIKKEIKDFYVSNPPRNRKERRLRAREIKNDIIRFKEYCKNNGIEIKK